MMMMMIKIVLREITMSSTNIDANLELRKLEERRIGRCA